MKKQVPQLSSIYIQDCSTKKLFVGWKYAVINAVTWQILGN